MSLSCRVDPAVAFWAGVLAMWLAMYRARMDNDR